MADGHGQRVIYLTISDSKTHPWPLICPKAATKRINVIMVVLEFKSECCSPGSRAGEHQLVQDTIRDEEVERGT